MGVTVIGADPPTVPQKVYAARVYVKEKWHHTWEIEPELELDSVTETLAGKGVGSCKLNRAYGRVIGPQESSIGTRHAWNLMNFWVSIRLRGPYGSPQEVWRGRISAEPELPHGDDVTDGGSPGQPTKSGEQSWTAYSAGKLLEKIHVTRSFWYDTDDVGGGVDRVLDWMPGMNHGDDRLMLVGNRSDTRSDNGGDSDDCYVFGGSDIWS
ncbi:MAG: hypothetical protein GY778_19195, partial [bacterium]|nr:hypothetical protein [bacterium]